MPNAKTLWHVLNQIATHQGNIGGARSSLYFRRAHCLHDLLYSPRVGERGRTGGQGTRTRASAGSPSAKPYSRANQSGAFKRVYHSKRSGCAKQGSGHPTVVSAFFRSLFVETGSY